MKHQKSEAMKQWNGSKKFTGLCEECISKTNKEISFYVDRDLCKNHFLRSYKERHGG